MSANRAALIDAKNKQQSSTSQKTTALRLADRSQRQRPRAPAGRSGVVFDERNSSPGARQNALPTSRQSCKPSTSARELIFTAR